MTAYELAVSTDIFKVIEYQLYAHLASGQRLGANLSGSAFLSLICMGDEAAATQRREIADVKAVLSSITMDTDTMVITVTFKGKRTATRWVNWRLPLARRMLKLHDYKQQREAVKLSLEFAR
ncbi:hypothetical protein GQ600_4168 [Phytophthora cactorum]|nr:hypothetical protein GQ600_4168 [Phytophthora cactorum]KAG3023582.1 hypothetical protein PC120_g7464 [Phytophthora cactorum]KAG4057241.1 hypothetical protein PC123_g7713 [Phytophthora cactorum]